MGFGRQKRAAGSRQRQKVDAGREMLHCSEMLQAARCCMQKDVAGREMFKPAGKKDTQEIKETQQPRQNGKSHRWSLEIAKGPHRPTAVMS